jgi:hypothetical protein
VARFVEGERLRDLLTSTIGHSAQQVSNARHIDVAATR